MLSTHKLHYHLFNPSSLFPSTSFHQHGAIDPAPPGDAVGNDSDREIQSIGIRIVPTSWAILSLNPWRRTKDASSPKRLRYSRSQDGRVCWELYLKLYHTFHIARLAFLLDCITRSTENKLMRMPWVVTAKWFQMQICTTLRQFQVIAIAQKSPSHYFSLLIPPIVKV